jgi:predicted acyl esterase
LKGKENSVRRWPTVQLDVRTSADVSVRKDWPDFPPPAKLSNFHLASKGKLLTKPGSDETEYTTFKAHHAGSTLTFDHTFDKETEITGHASLTLHVQCMEFPDIDFFVALQKLDADGKEVKFTALSASNSTQLTYPTSTLSCRKQPCPPATALSVVNRIPGMRLHRTTVDNSGGESSRFKT